MTYIPPVNGGRINATISGNTAGVGSLVSSGTLTLAGGNNITLSQNGNAVTISGGAGGAAGSNTFGMSNLGNTVGTSGVVSGSAVRFAFAGGNNITLSQSLNASSGTITISAANQTVQTQNLHNVTLSGNTAGVMAQVSSGTLTLAGGNNITLSQNGNAVTISGAAGGGGGGIALANSQTTYTSGTANLAVAGGAMTIASTTGQSFNFSVPQTSSLSATGALSISTNGSTISIGAPAFSAGISDIGNTAGTSGTVSNQVIFAGGNNVTLSQSTAVGGNTISIEAAAGGGGYTASRFIYPNSAQPISPLTASNNSVSINYVTLDHNVTASQFRALVSVSASTHTSASTNSYALTAHVGVYTRNGSTINLASSGTQTWSGTYSSNQTASVAGLRELTIPMDVNLSAGEYWFGMRVSSASTNASLGYSIFVASGQTNMYVAGRFGSATNASQLVYPWNGLYSSTSSTLPSSIPLTSIQGSSTFGVRANFWFDLRNYTVL